MNLILKEKPVARSNPTRTPIKGRTVLIVDDEPGVRTVIAAYLAIAGYSTFEAESAEETLERLEEVTPDLILLDYVLPDMNGVLLLQIIRARPPLQYLPIIFVTGMVDLPTKQQALEFGAVDYIEKPFDGYDLVARVGANVRRKDQEEQARQNSAALAEAAQSALETSEQRFRTLVQNSFDLVCELDGSLRMAYVSPNHKDILGHDVATLNGADWLNFVHPEDRELTSEKLRTTFCRRSGVRTQARFRDKHKQWR
ncbi:MAG: response regulator, partial [Verrucomicrobia bacterium]|nr:response regulator [Verrucomicrobiota bacterium]